MLKYHRMGKGWKYEPKNEDYEWLSERIELSSDVAPSVAKVRLDNLLGSPDYTVAYSAAWQALLPRTQELAIPILYLQRHSLELVTKELIKIVLNIRESMKLAHEIFGEPATDEVLDQASWDSSWQCANGEHKFGPLFTILSNNLSMLKLPKLPQDFHDARKLFEDLDGNDVSRWRYRTVRGTPKTRQVESFEGTFNKKIVADIGASTRLMNRIVTKHARFDDEDEDTSFRECPGAC